MRYSAAMSDTTGWNMELSQAFQILEIPAGSTYDEAKAAYRLLVKVWHPDIRTVADNEQAGDQIASFLQTKACEPAVRLHCSLSGGRKTMTHYMGIAFQLFARPWDNLYHVMVAPEFEKVDKFFYPPKQAQTLTISNQDGSISSISTANADVSLIQ